MERNNIKNISFTELGLNDNIIQALKKEKIVKPTEIQAVTFEKINSGKSFTAKSYTGSGKTLAYILPLYINAINNTEKGNKYLILVPTHELAFQVNRQIEALNKNSGNNVTSVVITGNINITRQIEHLREKQTFVIGTPGRIHELIKKKKIAAHLIKTLVIDEGDKMLDDNNYQATYDVRKTLMRDTQILMFSASMSKKALEKFSTLTSEYENIEAEPAKKVPDSVKHMYVVCDKNKKVETVRSIINAIKPKKALIFVNGEYMIEEITAKLKYHHYNAECIYGKVDNNKRKNVINSFLNNKTDILVATDMAARGLHVDGIDLVINVTLVEEADIYLHRSGRCGRNGRQGTSISIVTENEVRFIKEYRKALGINIVEKKLFKGKLTAK